LARSHAIPLQGKNAQTQGRMRLVNNRQIFSRNGGRRTPGFLPPQNLCFGVVL